MDMDANTQTRSAGRASNRSWLNSVACAALVVAAGAPLALANPEPRQNPRDRLARPAERAPERQVTPTPAPRAQPALRSAESPRPQPSPRVEAPRPQPAPRVIEPPRSRAPEPAPRTEAPPSTPSPRGMPRGIPQPAPRPGADSPSSSPPPPLEVPGRAPDPRTSPAPRLREQPPPTSIPSSRPLNRPEPQPRDVAPPAERQRAVPMRTRPASEPSRPSPAQRPTLEPPGVDRAPADRVAVDAPRTPNLRNDTLRHRGDIRPTTTPRLTGPSTRELLPPSARDRDVPSAPAGRDLAPTTDRANPVDVVTRQRPTLVRPQARVLHDESRVPRGRLLDEQPVYDVKEPLASDSRNDFNRDRSGRGGPSGHHDSYASHRYDSRRHDDSRHYDRHHWGGYPSRSSGWSVSFGFGSSGWSTSFSYSSGWYRSPSWYACPSWRYRPVWHCPTYVSWDPCWPSWRRACWSPCDTWYVAPVVVRPVYVVSRPVYWCPTWEVPVVYASISTRAAYTSTSSGVYGVTGADALGASVASAAPAQQWQTLPDDWFVPASPATRAQAVSPDPAPQAAAPTPAEAGVPASVVYRAAARGGVLDWADTPVRIVESVRGASAADRPAAAGRYLGKSVAGAWELVLERAESSDSGNALLYCRARGRSESPSPLVILIADEPVSLAPGSVLTVSGVLAELSVDDAPEGVIVLDSVRIAR